MRTASAVIGSNLIENVSVVDMGIQLMSLILTRNDNYANATILAQNKVLKVLSCSFPSVVFKGSIYAERDVTANEIEAPVNIKRKMERHIFKNYSYLNIKIKIQRNPYTALPCCNFVTFRQHLLFPEADQVSSV